MTKGKIVQRGCAHKHQTQQPHFTKSLQEKGLQRHPADLIPLLGILLNQGIVPELAILLASWEVRAQGCGSNMHCPEGCLHAGKRPRPTCTHKLLGIQNLYHNGQRLELDAVFSPVLSHVFQGLVTIYFYPFFFQASAFVMILVMLEWVSFVAIKLLPLFCSLFMFQLSNMAISSLLTNSCDYYTQFLSHMSLSPASSTL